MNTGGDAIVYIAVFYKIGLIVCGSSSQKALK
jgi:hypothetical protein